MRLSYTIQGKVLKMHVKSCSLSQYVIYMCVCVCVYAFDYVHWFLNNLKLLIMSLCYPYL